MSTILFINRDPQLGWLSALEVGRVFDGQHPRCWRPLDEHFAWYFPKRARRPRGFHILNFDEFDPESLPEIWDGPRFRAPLLALPEATAGEIVFAARAHLGDEPTINRAYFSGASAQNGEDALALWRCCLEAGDPMAHFAIGYTSFELDRFHEAYAHLRHYVDLAPHSSWNWCWLGKAAAAIGETSEAEDAYLEALRLTERGGPPTDAGGAARRARHRRRHRQATTTSRSKTRFRLGEPRRAPSALDPQPLERRPNPLLAVGVQDRLVFEPHDEGLNPEQPHVQIELARVGHQHLLGLSRPALSRPQSARSSPGLPRSPPRS